MENEYDTYKADLLKSLILNFHMSAMIGLGKVLNPISQKIERNMIEAKFSIDMLDMLAEKTKGNLTDDEDRFLQNILTELRLNYVQEKSKPEPEPEKAEPEDRKTEKEEKKSESDKTKAKAKQPEKTEKKSKTKPESKNKSKKTKKSE